DGSTLVQGTSGIWFLANPAGTIDIPAGISGVAPTDPNQPPQETTDVPTSGPAPLPPQQEFAQGEEREPDGDNVITTTTKPVLVSGSGFTAVMFFSESGSPRSDFHSDASTSFNSAGAMTGSSAGFTFYNLMPGGSHAEFGTDGVLAWGRWIGPVFGDSCGECTVNDNYTSNQGFHYVVGMPTPSMPTTGSATYGLIGATSPTLVSGTETPGTFSGTLTVNFDIGNPTVGMNLRVAVGSLGYAISGNAPISGNTFSNSFFQGEGLSATTGASCTSGCEASVQGFFAGSSAERAGLGYHITDYLSGHVLGTAAFAKQ
ncbi:MAG: hypothetical protein AB7N24_23750, partial [Dehalococcoidia bacterium]